MAKSVASSLICSCLDYANSLLFGTSQKNISRLQCVQNTLARVIASNALSRHTNLFFAIFMCTFTVLTSQCVYVDDIVVCYYTLKTLPASTQWQAIAITQLFGPNTSLMTYKLFAVTNMFCCHISYSAWKVLSAGNSTYRPSLVRSTRSMSAAADAPAYNQSSTLH